MGTFLVHPTALEDHRDLPSEVFFDLKHQLVFQALTEVGVAGFGGAVDDAALVNWLKERGRLDAVGGHAFFAQLANKSTIPANLSRYRELLERWKEKRDVQKASLAIMQKAIALDAEVDDHDLPLTDWAIARLEAAAKPTTRGATYRDWAKNTARSLDALTYATAFKTGLSALDSRLKICPGDHTVLAGRPAMGKTALAMLLAEKVAEAGHPVAVFSLEQPGTQLMARRACARAKVDTTWLRNMDECPPGQRGALIAALGAQAKLPIWLDDTPRLAIRQLSSHAKRAKRALAIDRPGLVVVDYLQLMDGSQKRNSTREQDISETARGCKTLAREMEWAVVALCQLNRAVESRTDKRPLMSDLRESGAIEQNADQIVMIYRDDVYNPESREPGVAELIVRKNRHGPVGTSKVRFDARFTDFSDLSWQDSYPIPRDTK